MIAAPSADPEERQQSGDANRAGAARAHPAPPAAVRLRRVQTVLLAIANVVDQVRRARDQAEDHERSRTSRGHPGTVEHAGRGRSGEHEQVLAPLPRAAGAQQRARADGRRRGSRDGVRQRGAPASCGRTRNLIIVRYCLEWS